jgi:phosphoribosylamine--glycine ligase
VNPSRILVIGSGGREHALAWRLSRDPHLPDVLVAPGNDGMASRFERVALREIDPAAVVAECRYHEIDFVVVGPEWALAAGVSDALVAAGVPVFGASRAAARLESSKWFAKEVMLEAGVPTAEAVRCTDPAQARAALARFEGPHVVKADGLAAGKGVLVSDVTAEAEAFVRDCLGGSKFGESGRSVVIEEFLEGEEASVIAVCDGERFVLLPAARDYKRAYDEDRGPNTGGMGSYAPTPAVTAAVEVEVGTRVVGPVLRAMAARGTPYRGALYCGLMLGARGVRVVEFNARFGDPETQSIVPLLGGSFSRLLASAACGALDPAAVTRVPGAAVTVALVDEGYPDAVRGGGEIERLRGLTSLARMVNRPVEVFYAGIRFEEEHPVVRGGRAAYVMARDETIETARTCVYDALGFLSGSGWRCRGDIAYSVAGVESPLGGRLE